MATEGRRAPGGGGRGVAKAVEGILGGLALRGRQAQLLLHLVDHGAAAGVQQEVLERVVEFWDVALLQHHLDLRATRTSSELSCSITHATQMGNSAHKCSTSNQHVIVA